MWVFRFCTHFWPRGIFALFQPLSRCSDDGTQHPLQGINIRDIIGFWGINQSAIYVAFTLSNNAISDAVYYIGVVIVSPVLQPWSAAYFALLQPDNYSLIVLCKTPFLHFLTILISYSMVCNLHQSIWFFAACIAPLILFATYLFYACPVRLRLIPRALCGVWYYVFSVNKWLWCCVFYR